MSRPAAGDFPPYFARYIARVEADSIAEAIDQYAAEMEVFYTGLPEDKADYAYAPGKWTLKELLQHVIDAERIFAYRILRISRNDSTPLPSFDEDSYVLYSGAASRSFASIKEEFIAVRKSTDLLLRSLTEEQYKRSGVASNLPVTVNAIGFILFGHLLHHKQVLHEKYGV
jgi:hypothetical protein